MLPTLGRSLLGAALALGLAVPAAQAVPANDARGFVDTIGVNTHLFFTETVYYEYPMLKQRLQELGVRHIRDGLKPGRQDLYDRLNDLSRSGIKSTLINCDFISADGWDLYIDEAKNKVRNSVEALEGVNEPDLHDGGTHDGGAWWNDARGCNYWTYQLAKGANKYEYGPPLNVPIYGPSATGTSFSKLGDLLTGPHADAGNMHPYPGSEKPSGPGYYTFSRAMNEIRQANFQGKNVPVVATETGYHDALDTTSGHRPVSKKAAGIYMPRLFLEYAKAGVERTFAYELVDLGNVYPPGGSEYANHFGLFESDWSYKPSARALKNTIGFLDSPSAGPRQPLAYTLEGTGDEDGAGPAGVVKDSLFQKADGSWWLALWQDSTVWDTDAKQDVSNPANNVRVNLPRTMNVVGYRPTQGTGSVGSLRNSGFSANVSDDVLLIKLAD
jgi:hypothetical protein